jgi:hypothetical protein
MLDATAFGTQFQPPKIERGWSHASRTRRFVLAVIATAGLIAFDHWEFASA